MSNPLFDQLGGRQAAPQQMNPQQMVQQIKSNPAAMLQQKGLNIPGGMNDPQQIANYLIQSGQIPRGMNDPQQIANYLIQSGQIPQSRLTWAMQMMQRVSGEEREVLEKCLDMAEQYA